MNDPYSGVTYFTNKTSVQPYLLDLNLTDEELSRLVNDINMWKFYKGDQWSHGRPAGEPQVTMNYCRAFVDKSVAFLMSKGFHYYVEEEAKDITKPLLDFVWDDNNKQLLGLDMAQMGGVTGRAYVRVGVENFDPEEDWDMHEVYPEGRIRLTLLPTTSVFPKWDGHDRDKMIECKIVYRVNIEDKGNVKTVTYKEILTKKLIKVYMDDELQYEEENYLNEIPVVEIKNISEAGSVTPRSDLEDIVPLQEELNFKATDISDIINYHGSPITIVKGAKVTNLEKGARKIWGGLPRDADVFNLELKTDLSASLNYLDMIKTALFEIGSMPEDALRGKDHISNTTGLALQVRNQPIIDLTHKKWVTYGQGIKQINRLILKTARFLELSRLDIEAYDNLDPYIRYKTKVVFPDPLPKDILLQLQVILQRLNAGLESRIGALKELGEQNPDKKLEEILNELKRFENSMYDEDGVEDAMDINLGGMIRNPEMGE